MSYIHVHAKEINLFQNPFATDIDEALPCYQFELQNCDVLKDTFKPNGLIEFYAVHSILGKDRILGGFILYIVICNIVNQHEMEVAAKA